MRRKDTTSIIPKLFQLYIKGKSLRDLSKISGLSKSIISIKFKALYGDDYTNFKNNHGLLPIIKEYLSNPKITEAQKRKIKKWLDTNMSNIVESDLANIETPLFTDKHEKTLTYKECSHTEHDWKFYFEVLKLGA
jgi:hypothetical protein